MNTSCGVGLGLDVVCVRVDEGLSVCVMMARRKIGIVSLVKVNIH